MPRERESRILPDYQRMPRESGVINSLTEPKPPEPTTKQPTTRTYQLFKNLATSAVNVAFMTGGRLKSPIASK